MLVPTDDELLGRYARDDDHDAFAQLVRRYVALVYAAARRQTRGDPHLADDVTQAVMIVLARRAGDIAPGSVLPSWLLVVTRHCAHNALKIQARQRIHEHRAAVLRADEQRAHARLPSNHDHDDLSGALHEAIARLRERDRAGVVLHYFQNRTHQEVGDALGLSAGAARKRVERAVERMRAFLTGRGVAVTSAAVVASIHAEASAAVAVPAHLATSAFNVAMLTGAGSSAIAGGASLAIAQGVARMFALAKIKVAAAIVIAIGGAAALPLAGFASRQPQPAPAAHAPATAPADGPFTARVTEKIRVQFLGVAPHPADETQWRDLNGEPIDMPDPRLADNNVDTDSQPDQQIAIRVHAPPGTQFGLRIDNSRTSSNRTNDDGSGIVMLRARFGMTDASTETMSLRLAFATEPWRVIAEREVTDQPAEFDTGKFGTVTIHPPEHDARWGPARVDVHHEPIQSATARMLAIDDAGKEHMQKMINADSNNDVWVSSFVFDVPPERIRKVSLQVREFDKYVIARDISISPDVKSEPKIEVAEAERK